MVVLMGLYYVKQSSFSQGLTYSRQSLHQTRRQKTINRPLGLYLQCDELFYRRKFIQRKSYFALHLSDACNRIDRLTTNSGKTVINIVKCESRTEHLGHNPLGQSPLSSARVGRNLLADTRTESPLYNRHRSVMSA